MRLKRLEISGFKTFRDKVVLDFADGITAIVGPNGCGKSNVVDAIRWVIGEQRVKALRSKKMDDVVFHGSQDSAPLSMAEVVMTLSNEGSGFPGAYSELTEVSVARKVIRDGDSEYYLNKIPCRLLDIKEFFMGTGIGTKTYSLVEQGSVTSLVEAKPEDRRMFIEEAAGVSKYKSRKEAALRKIEATKENILRINDIIREVKSHLNSISRQAKRAEQYKEVKQRIKEVELTLALQSYADLNEKGAGLQAKLRDLQDSAASVHASLEAKESALDEIKAKLLENEELLARGQQELYEIKNAINLREKNIEFSRRQMTEAAERRQKDSAEINLLKTKKSERINEIENLQKNAEEAENKLAALKIEHDEAMQKVQELINADKEINAQLDEKRISCFDVMNEKSKLKNMITSLMKNIEDLKKRDEREDQEIAEDRKRLDDLAGKLQNVNAGLAENEAEMGRLAEKKNLAADELSGAKSALEACEERLAQIKEESVVKTSRLSSLREFLDAYKWCNEGVKAITEKQETQDSFYGIVADHIQVPQEYETAVEAVLGEKLQYVVVKSQEDGIRAIDYLKNYQLGRGSFVPVELRNHYAETYSAEHLQEAEPLLGKVTVKENFQQIADCLLGDVLITPSIESGVSLWKKNGFKGTFVTRDGDTISPHGVVTGGSGSAVEKSLLATKREISELESKLAEMVGALENETNQKKKFASLIAQWEEELNQTKSGIHQLEIDINGRKKDRERFDDETNQLKQRIAALEFNRQNIKSELAEADEKLRTLNADLLKKEEEEKVLNEVILSFTAEKTRSRAAIDEQERHLTSKKVLRAALEEKKEADLRTLARLQDDINAVENEVRLKEEEIISCANQLTQLAELIEQEQAALKEHYDSYSLKEAALADGKAGQNREDSQLKALEGEIREIKKNLDELGRQINEIDMQCREIVLHGDNLKSTVAEKHNVALDSLITEFVKIDTEKAAEISAALEKDKQTIENFGEVNLLAINEYEEHDKRYKFLSAQLTDLNTSLNALQRTITRINKISRERFAETFAAINACFKEVFTNIFPGGRGELLLTDENDLLETGVDIDIQIPGKRAQSVSLLSGGEKSLAAVALIFAILMYRPTPFLILDEVDAALDDANTNLINHWIKDIVAAKSQVVMITHNKMTMEIADRLFGVTMQKQGVSSLVSVSLN